MIQVFKPKLRTKEILKELTDVLDSGWVGLGPNTKKLEKEISTKLGVNHCVTLNSCTSALHLAIKLLDLPPNSKVLTTPLTFVSTNHAILYENLVPIFCDVEKTTGNIDVKYIKEAIKTHDIKALILVHFGGYPADMDKINNLCKKNNIKIIEDCAHAFGSQYKNKNIGAGENICAWSFQAVKNLPMGDAGAITTNNKDYYERLNKLRWLGINKDTISRSSKSGYKSFYEVEEVGYKYHLNDILSTIGLVQLKYIDEDNKRRSEIADMYFNEIKGNGCIKPTYDSDRQSAFHFLPLFFKEKNKILKKLTDNNIHPGHHYRLNTHYTMYKENTKINECKNAMWFEDHELTLPFHCNLTNDDIKTIIRLINNLI